MITQQIQPIQYLGPDVININGLLNLQNVDKIYFIDQDSNYIGWFSEVQHDYLQGLTNIQPGQMYTVYSKNSANYPYSLFLDYPDVDERLVSLETDTAIISGDLVTASGALHDEIVAASGDLYSQLVAASGYLHDQTVDVYNQLVAASGSLHNETADVYDQLIAASGDLHDHTVDVYGQLVAASGSLYSLTFDVIDLLVIASGGLNSQIIAASGDLFNKLVAASGDLNNQTLDVYNQLVAASGDLHDQTVDVYNQLVAASGSLHDETVDVYNHLVAASGSLHDETVAASGDLFNQLVAASGHLFDIAIAQPRYSFTVGPNSTDPNNTNAFRFAGVGISASNQDNPDIYLRRGETYVFDVNSPHHPFYIKTERTVGTASMYNTGVTNNGYTDRAITFEVPHDAPNVLYYQCSNHAAMGGNLFTYQPSAISSVDGGLADSFTDSGGGGGGGGSEEVYDTTYTIQTANVPEGQSGGGLTFYGSVGDSIEFTIITAIDNPLNLITLNIYISGSQLALLTITPEYRSSGNTFKVTINGTAYVVNFSDGTLVSGTTYRLDL